MNKHQMQQDDSDGSHVKVGVISKMGARREKEVEHLRVCVCVDVCVCKSEAVCGLNSK